MHFAALPKVHFYFKAFGATLHVLETAKKLRLLTLPFSWLYGGFMAMRNWFFDKKLTRTFRFDFPVICVGNLSTGGTGKTPHIEYIISLLKNKYSVGVVSRGYGRKTRGFFMVEETGTPDKVGDEPLQIKQNHPYAHVAVGEQRIVAIPSLLNEEPQTQVVLLDDAYQHRYVEAGLYILLTDYNNMFYADEVLPAGNLREFKSGYKRAHIIIVTKCPPNLTNAEKLAIEKKIKPLATQKVYYSHLQYGQPYALANREEVLNTFADKNVLFFAGIANAKPVESYLKQNANAFKVVKLADHAEYTDAVIDNILQQYQAMQGQNKILLTTQKDAVKLSQTKLAEKLQATPVFVLPLEIGMNPTDGQQFLQQIETYVAKELSTNVQTA